MLDHIDTEKTNPATRHIDRLGTEDMLRLINREDQKVAEAVAQVLPQVAQAVDIIYRQMQGGGRLVYLGSGTSGRLGVLDAAECPPTFGVDPALVVALIAGGEGAFVRAREGAEDDRAAGAEDLRAIDFSAKDVLVGIAASGRTPYVIGGMDYAASVGAPVIALVCTANADMASHAQVTIAPLSGPEVITGSTRMKSGTAQKMVLNMLSTGVMVKLGKVYGNLMVDMKATNDKLHERAIRIVMQAADVSRERAAQALAEADGHCKPAIVSLLFGLDYQSALAALNRAQGRIGDIDLPRAEAQA